MLDKSPVAPDSHEAIGYEATYQRLINVVKRSAISTGQLNTSPCVHSLPIDLVVFQGPTFPKEIET